MTPSNNLFAILNDNTSEDDNCSRKSSPDGMKGYNVPVLALGFSSLNATIDGEWRTISSSRKSMKPGTPRGRKKSEELTIYNETAVFANAQHRALQPCVSDSSTKATVPGMDASSSNNPALNQQLARTRSTFDWAEDVEEHFAAQFLAVQIPFAQDNTAHHSNTTSERTAANTTTEAVISNGEDVSSGNGFTSSKDVEDLQAGISDIEEEPVVEDVVASPPIVAFMVAIPQPSTDLNGYSEQIEQVYSTGFAPETPGSLLPTTEDEFVAAQSDLPATQDDENGAMEDYHTPTVVAQEFFSQVLAIADNEKEVSTFPEWEDYIKSFRTGAFEVDSYEHETIRDIPAGPELLEKTSLKLPFLKDMSKTSELNISAPVIMELSTVQAESDKAETPVVVPSAVAVQVPAIIKPLAPEKEPTEPSPKPSIIVPPLAHLVTATRSYRQESKKTTKKSDQTKLFVALASCPESESHQNGSFNAPPVLKEKMVHNETNNTKPKESSLPPEDTAIPSKTNKKNKRRGLARGGKKVQRKTAAKAAHAQMNRSRNIYMAVIAVVVVVFAVILGMLLKP